MIDIYSENIMDHYKNPMNFGTLSNFDILYEDSNPLCGDKINVYLKLDKDKIKDVKFNLDGCAISKAAASIVSEDAKGKDIKDILKLDKDYVLKLIEINLNPIRIKCALLFLRTMQKGIINYLSKNE